MIFKFWYVFVGVFINKNCFVEKFSSLYLHSERVWKFSLRLRKQLQYLYFLAFRSAVFHSFVLPVHRFMLFQFFLTATSHESLFVGVYGETIVELLLLRCCSCEKWIWRNGWEWLSRFSHFIIDRSDEVITVRFSEYTIYRKFILSFLFTPSPRTNQRGNRNIWRMS